MKDETRKPGEIPGEEADLLSLAGLSAEDWNLTDPDGDTLTEEAKEFFTAFTNLVEKAEEEFQNGSHMFNPEKFKAFREGLMFMKRLEKEGLGTVQADFDPKPGPASVTFTCRELTLPQETAMEFAQVMKAADDVEIWADLSGRVVFILLYTHAWIRIEDGGEGGGEHA